MARAGAGCAASKTKTLARRRVVPGGGELLAPGSSFTPNEGVNFAYTMSKPTLHHEFD